MQALARAARRRFAAVSAGGAGRRAARALLCVP